MKAIKVIERSTGVEYVAKAIEGGYEVYTIEDKGENPELYKKVKESTFKKYFKVVASQDVSGHDEAPKTGKSTSKAKSDDAGHVEKVSAEKREHMVEKIKKMLALAEDNPSMEEGLSAALQAQKLMAKYHITEDEVTLEEITGEEITSLFTHQKHDSQLHNWRKPLASVVAKNFCCKCYLRGKDVVFRGYRRDAEVALNVYMTLYNIGNTLGSKAYLKQKNETGSGKGVYNSFVTGFLKGVQEGLGAQCTALLVVTPKEVEEEWKTFSSGFRQSTSNLRVSDADVYNDGYVEGKYAVKSRSIEKKGGK